MEPDMRIDPEISSVTIVLRGHFNPKIFQPFWFSRHRLITDAAAESADINLIHPTASEFSINEHFSLHVDLTTFSITRLEAPLVLIADIVGRVFGELLPHTPIGQLGINRLAHLIHQGGVLRLASVA
jgi:hypothetical protein